MAASQYRTRLKEDLKEWRGLPELLVFPLKDIDPIGLNFAALRTDNKRGATNKTNGEQYFLAMHDIIKLALGKPRAS
jgi:hypothetical protein